MKRFKSSVLAGIAVLIFAAAFMPTASVSAQSSAALSIVPKKNYVVEPGKSIKDTLTIRNLDNDKPLQLTLRVIDFTFNDDGGTPKLMLDENAPQTTWSLKPFITIPKTVNIPAKGTKTVDMRVALPANQGAGSYYSAILYSSGAPEDGGNVGLSASGVTLAFVSVPGEVKENLTLENLGAYHPPTANDKGGYAMFTAKKPLNIAYTLKNEGNVTESPVGSITLKNILGQEQRIDNINPNSSLALIGQTRTFMSCIKSADENVEFDGGTAKSTACEEPNLWPGPYTVSLDMFYGQNGNNTKEINSTVTFWYLPWWFVITFIVLLLAATFAVWRLVQKFKGRQFASQRKKLSRRRK
jgi:hypothetical protein